jgi:sugar phosphate isomerase/epimerase
MGASGSIAVARPRVAAFPKGYFDLLISREMRIEEWISRAPDMELEGVELYPDFFDTSNDSQVSGLRRRAEDVGVELPMMCSSPDFVDPSPGAWQSAVEYVRQMIDVMVALCPQAGWRSVRVLSGQAWPGVAEEEGIARTVEGIQAALAYAEEKKVVLVIENHYKDGRWRFPEFALSSRVFLAIIEKISSPWFKVNFDPSNTIVAGEDPLVLLEKVVGRVGSMHASDRCLRPGYTIQDLMSHEGAGYPAALQHGVVGQGLNDYETICARLAATGFAGWISIEDGERGGAEGMLDIRESARFLRSRIDRYWPAGAAS